MLHSEIRPGMKENTVCKTKLENYRPVIKLTLLSKVFEYKVITIITNERSERSSYYQSYMGGLDDIKPALKPSKEIRKIEIIIYNHLRSR